jgi:hypothetical protein
VDSLKALDPKRPIREADIRERYGFMSSRPKSQTYRRYSYRRLEQIARLRPKLSFDRRFLVAFIRYAASKSKASAKPPQG